MNLSRPIVDERVGPKGADIAVSFAENVQLTYWDLWCLLAAQQKFVGSLLTLRTFLIERRLNERFYGSFRRDAAEDLIFLTEDLNARLDSLEVAISRREPLQH